MAKSKNIFFCQECGYESAKWLGQCSRLQSLWRIPLLRNQPLKGVRLPAVVDIV